MKTKLVFSYGEADFNSANYSEHLFENETNTHSAQSSIANIADILSRLDVEPLEMLENGVSYSWQQKQFFLHVVNLKKVGLQMKWFDALWSRSLLK